MNEDIQMNKKNIAKTITVVAMWIVLAILSALLIFTFPPYVTGILYIIIAIFIFFGVVTTAYIILS